MRKKNKILSAILTLAVILTLVPAVALPVFAVETHRVYYVSVDGTGEGTSWDDAMGDVQQAIDAAEAAGALFTAQVRIEEGTYYPTYSASKESYDPDHNKQHSATNHFSLRNNVTVIGGFTAQDVTSGANAPSGDYNRTVLSGDLNQDGKMGGNADRVFYHSRGANKLPVSNTAVLRNVTITGGHPNNASGGGMCNIGSSPSVVDCAFVGNTASSGGGMFNYESNPIVTNCIFQENATNGGEGGDGGGGMCNNLSSPIVTNCVFIGNTTGANSQGGGMYNIKSSPIITSCTFTDNESTWDGSGMCNTQASKPIISNTMVSGNVYSDMHNEGTSDPQYRYSIVGQGVGLAVLTYVYGADADDVEEIVAPTMDGDGRLKAGSQGIDMGDNATVEGHWEGIWPDLMVAGAVSGPYSKDLLADLAGNARIVGASVDIGAYEGQQTDDPDGGDGDSGGEGTRDVTVTFETNGGSAVAGQTIHEGKLVQAPESPVRTGYRFSGWYTDEACTVGYNFSAEALNSLTLYAGWSVRTLDGFADVKKSDWFYDSVVYAYENGLMAGTSDTTFAPDEYLSRAMLATMIWSMEGNTPVEETLPYPFTDLDQSWFRPAILWANENEIAYGIGGDLFAPYRPVTREETMIMLYQYAQFKQEDITVFDDVKLKEFPDSNLISDYAKVPMNWAVATKVINGRMDAYGNTFLAPQGVTTRAEAAAIVYRINKLFNETN